MEDLMKQIDMLKSELCEIAQIYQFNLHHPQVVAVSQALDQLLNQLSYLK